MVQAIDTYLGGALKIKGLKQNEVQSSGFKLNSQHFDREQKLLTYPVLILLE